MPSKRINPEVVAQHLRRAASARASDSANTPMPRLAPHFLKLSVEAEELADALANATHFTLDGDVLVAHY